MPNVQHTPPKDKKSSSSKNTTTDSGLPTLRPLPTLNLDDLEPEMDKSTDQKITTLIGLVENLAVSAKESQERTLVAMEEKLTANKNSFNQSMENVTNKLIAMQKEVDELRKLKNNDNDDVNNNIMEPETANNRFKKLENQIQVQTNQLQEQIKEQMEQSNQLGVQIHQSLNNSMRLYKSLKTKVETLSDGDSDDSDKENEKDEESLSLNNATIIANSNQQHDTQKESNEDQLARKQAMTLKTSGKIPRWETNEDLKKFLKHTIRTFAEDCGQKPKFLATWIHISLENNKNFHPFLLKSWAKSIVDEKPDISIPAFLKKFSSKVVPEKTTTFNFARREKETLTNAVWRTLDETDSDDAVTPSGIIKALWVNEKDPWVLKAIKENFKWNDDITEDNLKKNAEKVDASCDYDFYKKSNEDNKDTIINIDAYQQRDYRLNQPYRPMNRSSTPVNGFNTNPPFKYCRSCKNKFYPRQRYHSVCNPCFYDNNNFRTSVNRYPNLNYDQRNMNRYTNQQNNLNPSPNRNYTSNPPNNRYNNNFQNNRPASNQNNQRAMIKVLNLTEIANLSEMSNNSRIGISTIATNDFQEKVECVGLVDSGANRNVVSRKFLERNGISFTPKTRSFAQTANPNASVAIIGNTEMMLGENNQICSFDVTKEDIGENSDYDFILGTPFLNDIGVMHSMSETMKDNYELKNM